MNLIQGFFIISNVLVIICDMKRITTFIIYLIFTLNTALADTIDSNEYISELNIPWKNGYNFEWWSELLSATKGILARAVEFLPMLILIVLLLACVKIIFDWDGKAWLKRIKYILIWVWLMILAVYLVNILSTIFFWHPVLNIHLNRWY